MTRVAGHRAHFERRLAHRRIPAGENCGGVRTGNHAGVEVVAARDVPEMAALAMKDESVAIVVIHSARIHGLRLPIDSGMARLSSTWTYG